MDTPTLGLPRFRDSQFGETVRRRRAQLHLPRRAVAAALGVSEQFLADLEQGQQVPASPAWLAQLAWLLAVDLPQPSRGPAVPRYPLTHPLTAA
jgi:transcriptional regulator with XRE-family HTH domain